MAISVSFFYYEVQGVGVPKYIGTGIEVDLGGTHRTCVNENISHRFCGLSPYMSIACHFLTFYNPTSCTYGCGCVWVCGKDNPLVRNSKPAFDTFSWDEGFFDLALYVYKFLKNTKKSSDSGVLKLRVICKITQPDHYRMAKFCIWVQRTPGVFLFFLISSGVRRIFVGKALRLKDQKYYWTSREISYPSTDNAKSSVRLKFELNTFMTWLVKYFT